MDFAAHEGRVLHGQGLSYALTNRGAGHMYATFYSVEYPLVSEEEPIPPGGFEGKADRLIERKNLMALNDSGVVCKFSRNCMTPERYEKLFGENFDALFEVGKGTVTLERHFHNQRGFDRADDRLPYEDELPDFEDALDAYYDTRGWLYDGTVPPEKISE